jgi:GST-like protein
MIDLYGMSSPNVHKVSIMLAELALPYHFRYVNVGAEEQFEPWFTALNPLSKVPVLVDSDGPGGEPYSVFESGAILVYLAEKHGRFLPPSGRDRFEVIKWLMVQMGNVGPMFGQLTHFLRFAPSDNAYSCSRYCTLAGRLYDTLDRRLQQTAHLGGEQYSVADIATYPWVSLYHDKHRMSWDDHPHLLKWCNRIAARPAVTLADLRYREREACDPSTKPGLPVQGLERFFGWGKYARS